MYLYGRSVRRLSYPVGRRTLQIDSQEEQTEI
jgi:hypothetical protein